MADFAKACLNKAPAGLLRRLDFGWIDEGYHTKHGDFAEEVTSCGNSLEN
jgi:hypothetical protein